ncbi:hypothetical protein [uncultured Parasphingorhabdus sp.]|uniref:hypothetical protein n=1 Tax=uncultured Parasphingorhabdus sp. TaxID=2709694 RepID=UPI0030DA82EC|tara:strand:- start:28701 stop:29051 length:351 start_codon:yes stop_codon:yes gene_type:complete
METYKETFSIKRLWIILTVGMVFMFGILLLLGAEIYQKAPPIPETVKTESGEVLIPAMTLKPGKMSGNRLAGSSKARFEGMTAISRRTGADETRDAGLISSEVALSTIPDRQRNLV